MYGTDSAVGVSAQRAPDEEDLLILIKQHEPLFKATALRLGTRPDDMEDALQGARLGFIDAYRRFDPARGVPIGRYARDFIKNEILIATFRKKDEIKTTELTAEIADTTGASDDRLERAETRIDLALVTTFLRALPVVQRQVAVMLGFIGMSAAEVGRRRGVSTSAVCKAWRLVREAAVTLRSLGIDR